MASKAKTVTVRVERVSVEMPFLVAHSLRPFRRRGTLISLDTEGLSGTACSQRRQQICNQNSTSFHVDVVSKNASEEARKFSNRGESLSEGFISPGLLRVLLS